MSHLRHLRSIVLIHPKYLDGKYFPLVIRGLPNVGESAGRDGMLAFREGRFDLVRVREQPIDPANLAQRSDASCVDVGFG